MEKKGVNFSDIRRVKGIVLKAVVLNIFAGGYFGYATAVVGSTFFSSDDSQNTDDRKGFIAASILIGAFFGSLFAGWMADKFGRRNVLLVGTIVFGCIGTAGMIGSVHQAMLGVFRIFPGVTVGIYSSLAPLHMSECAPVDLRGILGTTFQLSLTFFIFLATLVGFINFNNAQRLMYGLSYLILLPMIFISWWITESPRRILSLGDEKVARDMLKEIFENDEAVEREVCEIRRSQKMQPASQGTAFSSAYIKHLLIGILFCFAQQWTGINAIIYFFQDMLGQGAKGESDSKIIMDNRRYAISVSAAMMFWNFLATFFATGFIEKFGRKTLIIFGLVIMFFFLIMYGSLFFSNNLTVRKALTIVAVFFFLFGFEMGIGPLFFIVINEIYPEQVRARVASFITAMQWLLNFVLTYSFPSLYNALGGNKPGLEQKGYVFYVFAAVAAISIVLLWFICPETKGKTFEEIQALLSGKPAQKTVDVNNNQVEGGTTMQVSVST